MALLGLRVTGTDLLYLPSYQTLKHLTHKISAQMIKHMEALKAVRRPQNDKVDSDSNCARVIKQSSIQGTEIWMRRLPSVTSKYPALSNSEAELSASQFRDIHQLFPSHLFCTIHF